MKFVVGHGHDRETFCRTFNVLRMFRICINERAGFQVTIPGRNQHSVSGQVQKQI